MITQREVGILTDAIKKHAGLEVPPDAALAALYALADYNFRLIPRNPEPHKYALLHSKAVPDPNPIDDMSAPSRSYISIVLADDHPLVLRGVAEMLSAQTDMGVLAMCTDGRAAAEAIRQLAPNVAVLDIAMPGLNGPEVLSVAKSAGSITKILFLTAFATDDNILAAIANGAQGIVVKDAAPETLIEGVRTVAAGRQWFPTDVVETALRRDASRRDENDRFGLLTRREQQIVSLVADGLRTKEIAGRTRLTEGTVKMYLHTIYEKLETPNRIALTIAFRHRRQ